MQGFGFKARITTIILFIAAVMGVFFYTLYDMQIVRGAEYLDQSQNSITQTVKVAASRGEILDRYGRVLVSNRVSYNIIISRSTLLRQERPNDCILTLIDICDSFGVEHADALPLSKENSSEFLEGASDTQMSRLRALLDARGIDPELGAGEIFERLCERYKVDEELSFEQKRAVIGVRYELELRTVLDMTGYVFAKDVGTALIAMIKEYDLTPVSIETGSVRVYNTQYAAHLLGSTGQMNAEEYEKYGALGYPMDAIIGKDGVEAAFEELLAGTDGKQTIQTNMDGSITGIVSDKEAVPGNNVKLTIDIGLQAAAENILASTITQLRQTEEGQYAEGGAVVVVEVGTGDLLASASYPTYNLATFNQDFNELRDAADKPLLNRALSGLYEPGSTFKMVTTIAAMESDTISSGTTIVDEGVYKYYTDYQPVCWIYSKTRGTHGAQTVIEAIGNSCNYFFYEVGRLTGIDRISQAAHRVGLGENTGIELPEYVGVVASAEQREESGGTWNPGDTLQAAIGQSGNSFTPLQLANYIATLANGGVRMNVHLLKSACTYDYAEVTMEYEPEVALDLQLGEDTLYAVTQGMRSVVTVGTASETFAGYPVEVAAKTGSAQIGQEAANGIFVCYAPFENPEIAIAVVVEKGGSGGAIATIAKQVMDYYFANGDTIASAENENTLLP